MQIPSNVSMKIWKSLVEFGIVRDSILNSTNDFQIFMETFEGICMVGHESLVITSTVCPNGSYPAGATAFAC